MILKNKLTYKRMQLSYTEFQTYFKKEIQSALDSYIQTQNNKPNFKINSNFETDFYFNLQWNFNHFGIDMMIKQLSDEYEKIKNTKISNREKVFTVLKKIFNLTDEEINIFALFARNELSETFCDCLCLASDKYGSCNEAKMCKVYLKNSPTINESINHLRSYGLLQNRGRRGFGVGIPNHLELMLNNQKTTEKQIVEKLIGKNSVTKLRKKDFAHLKNEFDTVKLILQNSMEQKLEGINILFYGEVGTGKTEFARVISKALKTTMYKDVLLL